MHTLRCNAYRLMTCLVVGSLGLSAAPVKKKPIALPRSGRVQKPDTSLTITAKEGTGFGVVVSPQRDKAIINLQTVLYAIPGTGGTAVPIADPSLEPVRLDWSKDGQSVLMQAYKDGMFHLFTVKPDGTGLQQLTEGPWDDTDPRWSSDGKRIVFISERGGNKDIWTMDVATKQLTQITNAGDKAYGPDVSAKATMLGVPVWLAQPDLSPSGKEVVYVKNRVIEILDLETKQVRALTKGGVFDIGTPTWSPDGRLICFRQNGAFWTTNADGSGDVRKVGNQRNAHTQPAQWLSNDELAYAANGRIWITKLGGETKEIPFEVTLKLDRPAYARKVYDFDSRNPKAVKGIVGPVLAPKGDRLAFKALDDLWLMPVGGKAQRLTQDSYYETDPAWSFDGSRLAYASDKEGSQDLYIYDLTTQKTTRLTTVPGAEVAPAWSPDGQSIAYETEVGALMVVDVASGKVRELVKELNAPGKPSWSPDGQTLLVAALHDAKNRILAIDVATGKQSYYEPSPGRSISTRGDDGPVWSGDGKQVLFSMASTLWELPVDAKGMPQGSARQLTQVASDAPTWSQDGQKILYLQNGTLTLLDRAQGTSRSLDTGLTWKQEIPNQRILLQVARVWNGVDEMPIENMDVLVVNNRIQAIKPRGAIKDPKAKVVDATSQTLVPGLFDMHVHQQMRSKFWGDRLGRTFLAYGITSTRSTGDHVYRALRDKEAYGSGTSVGPRHFMTGEMLEGKSLEWEFSRPVENAAQLDLELSRAQALDYDLIKTYVRFPSDLQAKAIEAAHKRLGVSLTTHYFFPGVAFGQDGAEHGGGPTRWDSGNMTTGGTYLQDVWPALVKTQFEVTTTNFSSAADLARDASLLQDPRFKSLFPRWEQQAMEAVRLCALGKGPCGFLPPNEAWSKSAVQSMTRLMKAGVKVMAGTDSPLEYSYAAALQLNLRALAKHGMTPFETLQTATIVPARAQGVAKDLGSIEVGKVADMVLVEGDPSKNMDDLIKVRRVMKDGHLYTVEDLMKPFASPQ